MEGPRRDPLLRGDRALRRAAVAEGISKIRLTGGEPLVRKGIVEHIRAPARDHGPRGDRAHHERDAAARAWRGDLVEAGLERVNISLDSLDPEVYAQVTRGGRLADALAGIDAAFAAGMHPIKINVVVVRRLDQDLLSFARMTIDRPLHVRFIEYMPVGGDERAVAGRRVRLRRRARRLDRGRPRPERRDPRRALARGRRGRPRRARARRARRRARRLGPGALLPLRRARPAPSASSRRCRTTSAASATACG